jgi:hypothetical protein
MHVNPLLEALTPQASAVLSAIISSVTSVVVVLFSTQVALRNERRQLRWSKELDRFFALEELAGRLVEELASYRAFDRSILAPMLEEYRQVAGRFARYDRITKAILQLENTADRMFAAKRDHSDDTEALRSELDSHLQKLLRACDQITGRSKWF